MKAVCVLAILYISLIIGEELQADKQSTEIGAAMGDHKGKSDRNQWKRETGEEICNGPRKEIVQSVYVDEDSIQLFIEHLDGSKSWSTVIISTRDKYPKYKPEISTHDELGYFTKMNEMRDSSELMKDGKFKRVSASFLHFSDGPKEKGYLVMGLSAYEFVKGDDILPYYQPTENVKPISDFFKEGDKKLLMPEDKLEEAVSVALIKWVERDKIKDHALYKIILKTVTKKLVKAYFKLTSKGEVISLNSEPFVPSVELLQDENEFGLLEESALYYVRDVTKLSIGYKFTSNFAYPIYYEYNPDKSIYKEYPMRTKEGFNSELETLGDRIPSWSRYIVPTATLLGCPETTFCLGRSFDAVFYAENQYYAIYGDLVYTFALTSNRPGSGEPLTSVFPFSASYKVDAAFTVGVMVFFLQKEKVRFMANISEKHLDTLKFKDIFPGIDDIEFLPINSVSAVITLDKDQETDKVNVNELPPSKSKSAILRKNRKRHERAAHTTKEDIPKEMVYVYFSHDNTGNVYQFKMATKTPPKFELVAKKTYTEVNAALPFPVSLVFTADGKVVTMFNHFMIEQSSATYFTQTENQATFTLIDKYFGCQRESVENELSKEFVQNYVKFAGPKAGENVFVDPVATQESTESTIDEEATDKVKDSSISFRISTASFIIQALVIILFQKILL